MIVGIVLLVLMLAGAGAAVAVKWSQANAQAAQFEQVPGVPGLKAAVPAGVELGRVGAVVDRAAAILAARGIWKRPDIDAVLAKARMIVSATDSWQDSSGIKVGGLASYAGIEVDRSLSSTLHELAHLMEIQSGGVADVEHRTWADRGIWAADEEFRAWLKAA